MSKDALLEIGTEEIPASYLAPAQEQMKAFAEKKLAGCKLAFAEIRVYATPCRLALHIKGIAEKSEDRTEEIFGPSTKAGRDAQGNFTQAAKGFAAKFGVSPEKLEAKKTEKGDYLCVTKKIPGEKADKLLSEMFEEVIKSLNFPKSMIWEPSGFRFARPIRTIVAMLGEKKLKIKVAEVKSNNHTFALHSSVNKRVLIKTAEKYADALRNACVICDPQERRKVIEKIIDSAPKRVKGEVIKDDKLLGEVVYLVEHPVAVMGTFDEKYLKLPHEVLTNCLAIKQKYFAIKDSKGNLTNNFLGLRNGMSENNDIVREGYERVLRARLEDAEFFFHKDTATSLASKVEKLKGVVFQQKLGTVFEKIYRIKQLALSISSLINVRVDESMLDRAANLSKADLVTDMVFEYPELQGVVGRIYARKDGENEAVSRAIEEHYWPLNAESPIPKESLGILLALADKIDTLAGDFAAGLLPSGSYDPYGLRRMAVGILRILDENNFHLSLKALTEQAFNLLPGTLKQDRTVATKLLEFFRQRLENLLENQGYAFDEVRAVVAQGFDDTVDVKKRVSALKEMRNQKDFESLATAFKRASNILKQAKKMDVPVPAIVDQSLLTEDAEKELSAAVKNIESGIVNLIENKKYLEALQKIVTIRETVDKFFEKVMVMTDDVKIRSNRLALLTQVLGPFYKILDFSFLQGTDK